MAPRVGKSRRTARARTGPRTQAENDSAVGAFASAARDRLNSKIGENTVMDMHGKEFVLSQVKEYISTQCYGLNWAMHLPGLPVGRVNVIRGDFMSGKSTLALHLMAETQRMGGFAVYIDTEYAFDEKRALAVGVDLSDEKWMLVQVDTVEKAVTAVGELIEAAREEQDGGTDRLVTIVWDSVSATATDAEMTEEFGASRPGLHARLLSSALRRLTPQIAKYRIMLLLVNQEKDRVDFFAQGKDIKTMIAERPLMFHASVVLRPQHKMTLTNSKKEPTGIRVITTVKKNKLAAPFSKAEFIINFATGIDSAASILGVAEQMGLVKKSGSWYSYQGQKFYEKDFAKILKEHPEIMEELEAIRLKDVSAKAAVDEDDDDEPATPAGAEEDDEDEDE